MHKELDILKKEEELFSMMVSDLSDLINELEHREQLPLFRELMLKAQDLNARVEDWEKHLSDQFNSQSALLLDREHGLKIGQDVEGPGYKILSQQVRLYHWSGYAKYCIEGIRYRKHGILGKKIEAVYLAHEHPADDQDDLSDRINQAAVREQREEEQGTKILNEYFGLNVGDDLSYTLGIHAPGIPGL